MVMLKTGALILAIENCNHLVLKVTSIEGLKEIQNKQLYFPISLEKFNCFEIIQRLQNMEGLVDIKFSDMIGD